MCHDLEQSVTITFSFAGRSPTLPPLDPDATAVRATEPEAIGPVPGDERITVIDCSSGNRH